MNNKETIKIKLWGIVQGVGFRPFVAKTADRLNMKGNVMNIGGLVEIILTDTREMIDTFIDTLKIEKPEPAEIVHTKLIPQEYREFRDFQIIKSHEGDDEAAMIPADLSICPHCLEELYDKNNPRFQHPFISCMICGPRYTIIDKIPYDRGNTSMIDFPMCDFCDGEYKDLHNRRYHAQTISCHSCGPSLLWKGHGDGFPSFLGASGGMRLGGDGDAYSDIGGDTQILDHAAEIIVNGGVIAFKSVGGYNLVADPLNNDAVTKLRRIKSREQKPFAVMFRSLEQIKEFAYVDDVEEKLLESSARPIILLEHKDLPYDEINRSRFIGSFLPSFAAQYMLLDRISPLIFTSANLSDMPMIKDDIKILKMAESNNSIDGILYNERQIKTRADDSVVRVIDKQPQMIRRSKGYAPVPLYIETTNAQSILATGGQLKNSFALTKGSFLYMSQFFGDMDTVENQKVYKENLSHLEGLFRIKPHKVVCDLHPLYFTTAFAEDYAKEHNLPLIKVQHHHAHVASVMAENNLTGKVIGVSFDGTGYGTDGCIWGGEIFICEGARSERIAHLKYVDMIGGDSSVKDASHSALSYVYAYDHGYLTKTDDDEIVIDISDITQYGSERLKKTSVAALIIKALENNINTVKSSSMGRLFDGVSALLGIKTSNDYEGQCAIMLEDAAAFAQKHPGEKKSCDLALSFHQRIIDMIVEQCHKVRNMHGATQVALTGGTFQNKILMEGVLDKLRSDGFEPYYNISVSPNDGGIALGQAYIAMHTDT